MKPIPRFDANSLDEPILDISTREAGWQHRVKKCFLEKTRATVSPFDVETHGKELDFKKLAEESGMEFNLHVQGKKSKWASIRNSS